MQWASAISTDRDADSALAEVLAGVRRSLGGVRPDLVLAFLHPHHAASAGVMAAQLAEAFEDAVILGCSGGGVIGGGREVEDAPALALTVAVLPGVSLEPFFVPPGAAPPPLKSSAAQEPSFILLADPHTCDVIALVDRLDHTFPGCAKVGGLASGARGPGENLLIRGRAVHRGGAVGVALSGPIVMETIVAQGCRPVGDPLVVTRATGNVVHELGGRPPIHVLRELHEQLDPADQKLLREALLVGLEMRTDRVEYAPGDLLVRPILGLEPDSGAIAVGAALRPWQVLQFLVRDARAAAADLTQHLERAREQVAPSGALLFSCRGRGEGLYGAPDHDSTLFRDRLGPVPLGGFFCDGEIGPVAGVTFVHGFTSSFGLFRARSA